MILRFLEIALLVAILWRLVARDVAAGFRSRSRSAPPKEGSAGSFPPNSAPEPLLRCATCGVLVPASRAWRAPEGEGVSYCSRRCLAAAP